MMIQSKLSLISFERELWEKDTADGEMCGGSALTQYELEEMKKNQK